MTLWDDHLAAATIKYKSQTASQLRTTINAGIGGPAQMKNAMRFLLNEKIATEAQAEAVALKASLVAAHRDVEVETESDGELRVYLKGKPSAEVGSL